MFRHKTVEPAVIETPYTKRQFFKHDPVTSIFLVIAVFFISQIAAQVILSVYPSLKNWSQDQATAWLQDSVIAQFAFILMAESFAIWLILKLVRKVRATKADIGLKRPYLRDIAYAVVGYGVYFAAYIVLVIVAGHFTKLNTDQPQKIGFDSAGHSQLYLVFLSLVVLPPIAEEIMFRGFLFTSLRRKFRFRYAVILTSILFGIAHLQFGNEVPLLWVAALDTFTLSCVLCGLREKTGSLWASIILHALKNSIAFIALFHTKF